MKVQSRYTQASEQPQIEKNPSCLIINCCNNLHFWTKIVLKSLKAHQQTVPNIVAEIHTWKEIVLKKKEKEKRASNNDLERVADPIFNS